MKQLKLLVNQSKLLLAIGTVGIPLYAMADCGKKASSCLLKNDANNCNVRTAYSDSAREEHVTIYVVDGSSNQQALEDGKATVYYKWDLGTVPGCNVSCDEGLDDGPDENVKVYATDSNCGG